MSEYPVHYVLSYSDGQVLSFKLSLIEDREFERNQISNINNGVGYIIDHNQHSKHYYNRNVVSLLRLSDSDFNNEIEKDELSKMKQIGFKLEG
ncbi:hypothetical protein ACOMCP_00651 [Lactiplantibacillus plantarum]|uniref:Uncharacterized protein n=1 Tax=Lactiplantibacillus plantarum TaxID=1590 RepID=A0A1E3KPC5_LACPN|nr:hypothetical protein [Lactiplantibacillus plantarum]ODO60712.1 hypothetical protein LPJSA22_00659 [Lactiplantibacillus plantarum]WLT35575.1 hypothetical protein FQU65_10635 [Lactiplantibacillus plantarum]